jgi:hypothetical protein
MDNFKSLKALIREQTKRQKAESKVQKALDKRGVQIRKELAKKTPNN